MSIDPIYIPPNSCPLFEELNNDLKNEIKHMMFYLHSASNITGIESIEIKEFLLKQAASEMGHVGAFSDMLVGLGITPNKAGYDFPTLTKSKEILEYALQMELEVIKNYTNRIKWCENLGNTDSANNCNANDKDVDYSWIVIFLEEQIMDSRKDADLIKQLLK